MFGTTRNYISLVRIVLQLALLLIHPYVHLGIYSFYIRTYDGIKTILCHKLVYFNVTCFIIDTKLWIAACYTVLFSNHSLCIFRLKWGGKIEVFVAQQRKFIIKLMRKRIFKNLCVLESVNEL